MVGFDVPCAETLVVLELVDVERVGGDGSLDDLNSLSAKSVPVGEKLVATYAIST